MRHNETKKDQYFKFQTYPDGCPICSSKFVLLDDVSCRVCNVILKRIKCSKRSCGFKSSKCFSCNYELEEKEASDVSKNYWASPSILAGVILTLALAFCLRSSGIPQNEILNLYNNLRKDFPSQGNETWQHILSVLDKNIPTVKSIVLLHSEDKRTPDCLTKKLVSLFSGNENLKTEDITFFIDDHEEKDYGFALEHYRLIVEKFRVFVADLTRMPGNTARIFHSLCDEISSDIKPSLFIFTLKDDKALRNLKPMDRASALLKKAWIDLPENEISPLLSRVIRNVVDILPEKQISC